MKPSYETSKGFRESSWFCKLMVSFSSTPNFVECYMPRKGLDE